MNLTLCDRCGNPQDCGADIRTEVRQVVVSHGPQVLMSMDVCGRCAKAVIEDVRAAVSSSRSVKLWQAKYAIDAWKRRAESAEDEVFAAIERMMERYLAEGLDSGEARTVREWMEAAK